MGHFSRGQLLHSSGWRKGAKCIGFPKVTASSVPTFLGLLPVAVEGSHAWDVSPAGIILIGGP